MEIAAGAHHLTLDRQRALAGHCRSLVNGAVPASVPIVRAIDTDVGILNYYDAEGRMGLHQDKDESPASLAADLPVVSISIGDTARFLFGGLTGRQPIEPILLESGDAFVFGREARLRYHGVSRIIPGTAPPRWKPPVRDHQATKAFEL